MIYSSGKIYKWILGALSVFSMMIFVSCSEKQDDIIISRQFENEQWNRFDYLESDYNVVKAPMEGDVVMEVVLSEVYPNIYPYHDNHGVFSINMTVSTPDGGRRSRDYNFNVKDKDGNWRSEKKDGYYHFELPLNNEMSFNEIGDYHFVIENKYPKDPLYGVKSVEIKCTQIKY